MIFLESLINGEQDEKRFSESDLSFASNSLLKSGAFGSRTRNRSPGMNDVKGGTHAKWPKSFSVHARTKQTMGMVQAANSVVTLKISETE